MMSGTRDKLSAKIIEILNIGKEFIYKASLIPVNQESASFHNSQILRLKKRDNT